MKTFSYFLLSLIAFFYVAQLHAQSPQLKKWYLNQFEIDFSTGLPQINNLPQTYPISFGGTSSASGFARNSHGFYDDGGNILFYTAAESNGSFLDYRVLDGQGNLIGTLSDAPENSAEMSMIPFGCQDQKKYLLIYSTDSYSYQKIGRTEKVMAPCWSKLVYAIIDLSANTVSTSYEVQGVRANCPYKAQAISKPNADGSRWLYTNDGRSIIKCKIDFTQPSQNIISFSNIVHTENHIMNIVELELSHSQKLLAWTDRANDIEYDFAVMALDGNGDRNVNGMFVKRNIPASSTNSNIPKASGIEFAADNFTLYVGFNTFGTDTAKDGIYQFEFFLNRLTQLPNTADYTNSHIELANNGRMYVANANSLLEFTTSSITPLPSNTDFFPFMRTSSLAEYQNPTSGVYVLPDQVDGEIIDTNYSLPDVSHLVGDVCRSEAILTFPTTITNYTITVEKPFATPCVYQGTARRLDLTTICGIQCGGNACDNRYRIKIEATLCNGQALVVQSGIFNILCGPAAPNVRVGRRLLCPNETTWASLGTTYPQGTIIEWFQGSNLIATGTTSITGISGSFSVRVTDTNGCSVSQNVIIGLTNCDIQIGIGDGKGKGKVKAGSNPWDNSQNSILYPNPAQNQVTVQLFEGEIIESITIKDARGALLSTYTHVEATSKTLDISKLSKGFYLVEVISQNKEHQVVKLIVE